MRAHMRLTLIVAGMIVGSAMLNVLWPDPPAEAPGVVIVTTAPQGSVKPTIKEAQRTANGQVEQLSASTSLDRLAQAVVSEGTDPAWSPRATEAMTRALAATPLAHQSLRVSCARTLCEISAIIPGYRAEDVAAVMAAIQGGTITRAISAAGLDDRDVGEISDAPAGGGGVVVRRYVWRRS